MGGRGRTIVPFMPSTPLYILYAFTLPLRHFDDGRWDFDGVADGIHGEVAVHVFVEEAAELVVGETVDVVVEPLGEGFALKVADGVFEGLGVFLVLFEFVGFEVLFGLELKGEAEVLLAIGDELVLVVVEVVRFIAFPEPVHLLGMRLHIVIGRVEFVEDGGIEVLEVEFFNIGSAVLADETDEDVDFVVGELYCALAVDGYFTGVGHAQHLFAFNTV